jgi:DNA polymerase I-like protein with 3'-5' exonuclease and polymerase domains
VRLIENFEAAARDKSLDVHRANAARIFKLDYADIPSYDRYELGKTTDNPSLDGRPTKRFLGKRCVHGLNYRMGPDRLAETCGISYSMALEAYNSYHRAFPEIKRAWDETTKEVYRTRELWSYMGRRLKFLGRLPAPGANDGTEEANVLESIVAFKPQSTIGDKVCACIYEIEDDPDWPAREARIILNVHDALIALVPDDDDVALHCARVMRRHAQAPILINGTPVIIPADFAWSVPDDLGYHRWSNLKKIKLGD